jgi:folate-dependent phosphoribosylglycinamide formyltransferase PurN
MQLIYDPIKSSKRMTIVCFVSGSGTNYREIVKHDPDHNYLVFTNRPGCGGVNIARQNGHEIIELSHIPYLKEAREKYGTGNVPRNCPERINYEQTAGKLIEDKLGRMPDVICLAGYDQWVTDWMVDRYYPSLLNVHPGDTTKGYDGLHWIPTAKAILADDQIIRSTLFIVDKGEDTGPVLIQSAPLDIKSTLKRLESQGERGLLNHLENIKQFVVINNISSYQYFQSKAGIELSSTIAQISSRLQDELKVNGDWKIYPFAVHDLIGKGRVAIEGRKIFIDGKMMPVYGYRLDK